jgi:CRISPR-associated protein Csd1
MRFDAQQNGRTGFCMVTGQSARIAQSHSRFVRRAGDGAKLISANDFSGYTFRGRFTDEKKDYEKQACSVSFEISQKAHSALRWLIGRQSYHDFQSGQVFVAWAVAGKPIPDPFKDTLALILGNSEDMQPAGGTDTGLAGDAGQAFALRLKQAIRGYRANLDPTDDIVVLGLDSATPGRMAITYYRELKGSEFLDRIQGWHEQYAWAQDFGKDAKFVGAPAPRDIAEAAYGTRLDDNLRKATVERLVPCIIDGQAVPFDLVLSTARRTANRVGLEHWEWEKCLGIACALFRGYSKSQGKEYQMALEEDRTTRDYLYGRLLALADSIEGYALRQADEKRNTTAARLMQRFADRPFSTWRNIELALTPYKSRLRASEKGSGFLWKREKLLDEIQCLFLSGDFTSDRALSGEFLLGYHCQRAALLRGSEPAADDDQPITE